MSQNGVHPAWNALPPYYQYTMPNRGMQPPVPMYQAPVPMQQPVVSVPRRMPQQDAFQTFQIPQQQQVIDASNDGQFSFKEAAKNFGKGLISPITTMFESRKNFLIGLGMIAAGAALIFFTGGAAAPVLLAAGVGMGVYQGGKAVHKIATAQNGDDMEKAFYDAGAATSSIGLSVLGARASLRGSAKATGLSAAEIDNMSMLQATVQNFKAIPASVRGSFGGMKGKAAPVAAATAPEATPPQAPAGQAATATAPEAPAAGQTGTPGQTSSGSTAQATQAVVVEPVTPAKPSVVQTVDTPEPPAAPIDTMTKTNTAAPTVELPSPKPVPADAPKAAATPSVVEPKATAVQTPQAVEAPSAPVQTTAAKPVTETAPVKAVTQAANQPGRKVGITQIKHRETKELVDAEVWLTGDAHKEIYSLRVNGQRVGYTNIEKRLPGNPDWDMWREEGILEAIKYSGINDSRPHLYVKNMNAEAGNNLFSGIGARLHQIAVERSMQLGGEGRVAFDASWTSHVFHYKSGFRPINNETTSKLLAIMEQAKATHTTPNTKGLGAFHMYLPDEQIAVYQQRITESPILTTE